MSGKRKRKPVTHGTTGPKKAQKTSKGSTTTPTTAPRPDHSPDPEAIKEVPKEELPITSVGKAQSERQYIPLFKTAILSGLPIESFDPSGDPPFWIPTIINLKKRELSISTPMFMIPYLPLKQNVIHQLLTDYTPDKRFEIITKSITPDDLLSDFTLPRHKEWKPLVRNPRSAKVGLILEEILKYYQLRMIYNLYNKWFNSKPHTTSRLSSPTKAAVSDLNLLASHARKSIRIRNKKQSKPHFSIKVFPTAVLSDLDLIHYDRNGPAPNWIPVVTLSPDHRLILTTPACLLKIIPHLNNITVKDSEIKSSYKSITVEIDTSKLPEDHQLPIPSEPGTWKEVFSAELNDDQLHQLELVQKAHKLLVVRSLYNKLKEVMQKVGIN